ncbi:MAG: hypothetical protein J6S43_02360 [Lentisphaeria bacterium]|nr:hypothetical protein [Lentisphaeria bacterium]
MKKYSTLICGATFYGIGQAVGRSGTLIVDPGVNPGHEFAGTFCTQVCKPEQLRTQIAANFYRRLLSLNAVSGGRLHPAALVPVLSSFIIEHGLKILMDTTPVKDVTDEKENMHRISLMNTGGMMEVAADMVIDTLTPPGNVVCKEFNALLHSDHPEKIPEKWLNPGLEIRHTPFLTAGRFASEAVLHFPCPPDMDYSTARAEIGAFWKQRPADLSGWKIAVTAQEFFEITGRRTETDRIPQNFCKNFRDPLSALDAGIMEAMSETV